MSPPAEQLIRDYLNRLSVAARGQLGADDRRALVDRTRGFIERKTGLAGPPTAIEVARLLAGLGDPARLVQQERQRLAAVRGEMPEPAAGRNPIRRVLRRDSGKPRTPSWHWPVMEGGRADLQLTLLDNDDAAGARASGTAQQSEAEQSGAQRSEVQQSQGPAVRGTAVRGTAVRGTAVRGTAVRGPAVRGTAVRGAAVRGAAVRGTAVRGAAARGTAVRGTAACPPWW